MNTLNGLNLKAEKYFEQLEKDKESTKKTHQYIIDTINSALTNQNISLLLSLIPYIEEDEGHLAYQYIGESGADVQLFLSML